MRLVTCVTRKLEMLLLVPLLHSAFFWWCCIIWGNNDAFRGVVHMMKGIIQELYKTKQNRNQAAVDAPSCY